MTRSRHCADCALMVGFCLLLITSAVLCASAPSAAADESYFFGLVTPTPMVHLPMAGASSYAQLIELLQSQGYGDVKVTPLSPNVFDPRPELMHPDLTFTSPDNEDAQDTPIHFGWNGTAVKDGKTFEVYVDRAPSRRAAVLR